MKQVLSTLFVLGLSFSVRSYADLVCVEPIEDGLKIKAFTLGLEQGGFPLNYKAAAIVQNDSGKLFLRGTVRIRPDRVGSTTSYSLTDEKGGVAHLLVRDFGSIADENCHSRAGCLKNPLPKLSGRFDYQGKTHDVECASIVF